MCDTPECGNESEWVWMKPGGDEVSEWKSMIYQCDTCGNPTEYVPEENGKWVTDDGWTVMYLSGIVG